MSVPIKIKIKIVLLMAKFESPVAVRRQLQTEFGTNVSTKTCTTKIFERFCETGTVEDRERFGRPSKITEEKVDEVHDVFLKVNHNQVFELSQWLAPFLEQQLIELCVDIFL
ncbi:unnamed protein product [Rotaria socialis]|uniref:DUF4817 domain-containing protein n=1 Tax=Rotaria socialis TaxID=392032 RepID=A0A821BCQ3_9BILA|nr:unnamed protein product [Rotaria socialis]CAF3271201.1 unnamed protein product [Rotaria socialis]CAF3597871.1 unnamed protein product [Rotaria socialis]CAF4138753.1 unnamed protein product [Rotaria socialis]CAF4495368.1 unnamed protein product [Rotaria socialis]